MTFYLSGMSQFLSIPLYGVVFFCSTQVPVQADFTYAEDIRL